jgi:hypothetical protein
MDGFARNCALLAQIPPPPPNLDPTIVVIVAVVCCVLFLALYPRRKNAAHNLRHYLVVGVFGYIAYRVAQSDPRYLEAAPIIGIAVAIAIYAMRPKRGRSIPKAVRRKTIADWEKKTGKKFNPRKHEIDHVVPFSKGGSHTDDNLRVLEQGRNRSKGAQNPWWDIFGLWQ